MAKALTKEKFIENHSAYFQQIGFDHQFAGCMYYLLDLTFEDKLCYERDDDFVIYRKKNGETITEYYQVKHSAQVGKKMTDGDDDFWKTIDNWLSLYELSKPTEQKTFFTRGRFIIITNKRPDNFLYSLIEKLRKGSVEIDAILSEIDEKLTKEASYNAKLTRMKALGRKTLNEFLHEVEIQYLKDFTKEMYQHFLDLFQEPSKSDQIVKRLIGELWDYKKESNGKFEFTGNEFRQQYKHLFELVTEKELTLDGFVSEDYVLTDNYEEMPMVQQLQSIEILDKPVDTKSYDFVDYMQRFCRFMSAFLSFQRTQLITSRLEAKIDKAAFGHWKRVYDRESTKLKIKDRRGEIINNEEKVDAGQNVFNNIMLDSIPVSGYKTDEDFSNGWYLRMSNMLEIVWHFDWFKKYISKK
jgi:hypothetical protein